VSWLSEAALRNEAIRTAGRWRATRDLDALGPVGALPESGRDVVSFASNDYLGMTSHPAVIDAARRALERWGSGSGSARLIVGSRPVHSELEGRIAAWKEKEAALLFPTGYAANLGVLTTFGTADTTIFSDELNHASIVDGCRLAAAEVRVFPHKDLDALERMMPSARRAIVVTDTVFSMDGDVAPVEDLSDLCARHSALLVLDEAHAVLSPHIAPRSDVERIRVGTLSKFLGSAGGFVAADTAFIDLLTNTARPFIFTTAGSPADAAAAAAALDILTSPEGEALVERLRSHVEKLMPGHESPIVPLVVGDERDALRMSSELLEAGYLVPAIRPPSVPEGSSRLRIALSAAHTDEQVEGLVAALQEIGALTPGA
jgi:8-amino-7-oxononanoate synthase